jgi:hypothetical protein
MTTWRTAVGVLGAVVALVACGGGDHAASPSAPAPATLAVAGSVSGSATTKATAPPSTGAPATARPPATATVPTTTAHPTTAHPTTTVPPAPAPCAVVVVGDSVGQDMFNNGFGASLANVGCHLAATTGARGITMQQGAADLAGARDVQANVAVVVLGYHNAVSQTRSGEFPAFIDAVMAAAGDRIVVWSLPGRTPDCGVKFTNAVAVESQLVREAMGRWPRLVPVDYPSVINAHPEYSQHRCPHLVNSGSRAVGAWLAGEVRRVVDASG